MKLFSAFVLVLAATAVADDFDTWYQASPDKKLFAVERRVPDANEPSRLYLDGCVVFICSGVSDLPSDVVTQGAIIAQHSFPGRVVSQICWSPDSNFLLFTTASSGGHSPWHFKTFVFCAADKSFRDVETAAGGPIGAGEFHFEPPDIAVVRLHDPAGGDPKQITLPLGKATQRMEHLK
jgi:hypothetical protein